MERIPPHNIEAEQSAIGACLLSEDALLDVLENVSAEDFYDKKHKEIYEAVKKLHDANSKVDVLTVTDELKRRNSLDIVGGRAYVATLSSQVPSTANAAEYAKIVEQKAEMRSLIEAAERIASTAYSDEIDATQIMDSAEQAIFDISKNRRSKNTSKLKDLLLENLDIISKKADDPEKFQGVPSGLIDLDRLTNGFQKSDMIVLAARPSMGKTAFALCVARNAAMKGRKVLVFSLEMSKIQLSQRLIAMESGVEAEKLRDGKLASEDWKRISTGVDSLSKASITIDDTPGLAMIEIKNKCRKMKMDEGLDLIIIDYLQLMNMEGRTESRQQEVSALSRMVKQLAREMDCPVLILSQLSRAPETRNDHRPILSDLRETGAIEQDADVVLFLYRDEVYDPETPTPNECEVIVAKQRNGPTGKASVYWQDKYTRFVNKSRG